MKMIKTYLYSTPQNYTDDQHFALFGFALESTDHTCINQD